jgi:hypothetical protein
VAGAGLVRSRVDLGDLFQEVNTNDWGLAVGGGVSGMLSDHVGLRGEVRDFRSLEDPEVTDPEDDDPFQVAIGKFDFWRATVGGVFRVP